jgi:hypothetical protein
MRQILREKIEEMLPAGLLASATAAEESERMLLRRLAGNAA